MSENRKKTLTIIGLSIVILGGFAVMQLSNDSKNNDIKAKKDKSSEIGIKIKDKSNDDKFILESENVDEGFLIDVTK